MTTAYPKEKDMTSVLASKGTRWLAALVASALVLALMVGGDQRSAQAIGPGETDIAYVADGYNFPDALMGATLAALNAAPMLGVRSPTTGDVVPPETADELDRLTNDKANPLATIYVFGGPAAVSDKVVGDLEAWADDVQRIFGDNRFATMEAISQMLPTKAKDSDLLDGMDSTDFLGAGDQAADSDLLDGMDSSEFLGSDAAVVHRMSVSASELWHDTDATEGNGFGINWGLEMPEGASSSFAYGFTLPDTYTAGDAIEIVVLGWMVGDDTCGVELVPNFTSFARPGMVPTTNGAGAASGLAAENGDSTFPMPGTAGEATTKTYTLEWSQGPAPGDTIGFSLFRSPGNADDTCTGEFHVGGLELIWG